MFQFYLCLLNNIIIFCTYCNDETTPDLQKIWLTMQFSLNNQSTYYYKNIICLILPTKYSISNYAVYCVRGHFIIATHTIRITSKEQKSQMKTKAMRNGRINNQYYNDNCAFWIFKKKFSSKKKQRSLRFLSVLI